MTKYLGAKLLLYQVKKKYIPLKFFKKCVNEFKNLIENLIETFFFNAIVRFR